MVLRRLDYLEFYNALTHQAWIIWIKDPSEIEITYKIWKHLFMSGKSNNSHTSYSYSWRGRIGKKYKHYVDVQGEKLPNHMARWQLLRPLNNLKKKKMDPQKKRELTKFEKSRLGFNKSVHEN